MYGYTVVLEKDREDQLDRPCDKWKVLLRVEGQRNILHEISKRKANLIGHIFRRNCLVQQVIEGKIKGGIEVIGRRGRRRNKLLDDLKERRGYSHLKEEALDLSMWTARFGRSFGPVVRQTTKWMNEWMYGYTQADMKSSSGGDGGGVDLELSLYWVVNNRVFRTGLHALPTGYKVHITYWL
jgi:hypothetical protein